MAAPLTTVTVDEPVSEGTLDVASLLPQILEKFLEILLALAILAASFFVIRMMRRKIQKLETAHEQQRVAMDLMEKIMTGSIVVLAVTLALKTVGIDMTLLVSVAVLGLSYALQDIIKNYVAGILILFKAPFSVGDIVKIKNFIGRVNKMDFQATMLDTFDNRHITIYNSDVMEESIINYSKNMTRRLEFDVIIGYSTDTKKAIEIFKKILDHSPKVLKKPKYLIVFKKFTDVGATYTLKFWVQRPCNILGIRTDIAVQIQRAFDDKSIYMPYYKGIEAGDEENLGHLAAGHAADVQAFYAQPEIAAAPVKEEEAPPPAPGGATLLDLDYEEPEA